MAQNWILIISEQHRYQGVSYKSDIIVISGLDQGDRQVPHLPTPALLTTCSHCLQVLEQKYAGCDPPCLLDSSDGRYFGRFLLVAASYCRLQVRAEGSELQPAGRDELPDVPARIPGKYYLQLCGTVHV